MKRVVIISLLLWMTACGTVKRTRNRIQTRRTGTIVRKVPGDSIIVTRHYIDTVYRDTVIVHKTKFLNLVESYDRGGTVRIKCQQKPVEEKEQYTEETEEKNRETIRERAGFKDIWFLYIGMILIGMVIVNKLLK